MAILNPTQKLGDYLLRIAPGRDGVPVLYRVHRPMEEVHGFHKSHYTTPSSKHSLQ